MTAQTSVPAGARELFARTTSAQGLPFLVEDPVVLDRLAVLLTGAGSAVDAAVGGPRRGRRPDAAAQQPVGTGAGPQPNVNPNHVRAVASMSAAAAQMPEVADAAARPTP